MGTLYLCLSFSVLPVFQVCSLTFRHLFKQSCSRKCLSQVAEELGTPLSLPPSSFLYSVSFFPPQNCQHSGPRGPWNVILPWGEWAYGTGLDLEREKSASGSIQSVELERSRRSERNAGHWPLVEFPTWHWAACRGAPRADSGRGRAPAVTWPPPPPEPPSLSVNTLLVKPMWLLSKLHSHRPKRNKKLLRVKMKVLWHYLPRSLSEHSKQRTPFFLT